jgi:hypothetical protein
MKKEYIKPFAKVKVVEMIVMAAESLGIDPSVSKPNTSGGAKEYFDFFDE